MLGKPIPNSISHNLNTNILNNLVEIFPARFLKMAFNINIKYLKHFDDPAAAYNNSVLILFGEKAFNFWSYSAICLFHP